MQIRKTIRKIKNSFLNLSLIKKMFILFALAGMIPLVISFIVSYKEICEFSLSNQKHMAKQGYEQTRATLSDQFSRIYNISTLITGNANLNESLKIINNSNDFLEQYAEYQKINVSLSNLYYSTEYDNIMYYLNSDFHSSESMLPFFRSFDSKEGEELKKKLNENDDKPVWILYNENNTYNSGSYLSLCRYIPDMSDYSKNIGVVMADIDLNKIRNVFILASPKELMYIRSKNGALITSNNDEIYKQMYPTSETQYKISNDFSEIWIHGKKYLAISNEITNTNLELVSIIPIDAINKSIFNIDKNMIFFYFGICFLMLIIIYALSKSISRIILLLSCKMEGIQNGKLEKLHIQVQKDEVGNLVTNYNYMIDEIQTLLAKQFELGQQKISAELKALQSQINPHFLYNTLDMINWMAQKNETDNIRDTVYALSKYYRHILNKGKDIITISDELQLCNAYISIQQKRFKGKIQFKIDVEENILMYLIPKITLQPLIENSILHGIAESESGKGTIVIAGREEDDNIILSVSDDGVGMDSVEDIERKHTGSGYGIHNIEMRLTLFYGMNQCISYESTKGAGTCVRLKIKKIKDNEEAKSSKLI